MEELSSFVETSLESTTTATTEAEVTTNINTSINTTTAAVIKEGRGEVSNAVNTHKLVTNLTIVKDKVCEEEGKHTNLSNLNTSSEFSNEQAQQKSCHNNNLYSNNTAIKNNYYSNKESSSHEHGACHTHSNNNNYNKYKNNNNNYSTHCTCPTSQSHLTEASHSTLFYNHHVDPFHMRRDDKSYVNQNKHIHAVNFNAEHQLETNERLSSLTSSTSSSELPLQTSRRLTFTAIPSKDKTLCKSNLITQELSSSPSSSSRSESQLMSRDALVLSLPETSTVYLHSVEHLSAPNSAYCCQQQQQNQHHHLHHNHHNTNKNSRNESINKNSPLCSLSEENNCNLLPEEQELQNQQEQLRRHQTCYEPLHRTLDVPLQIEAVTHSSHHVEQLTHRSEVKSQIAEATNNIEPSNSSSNAVIYADNVENKNKVEVSNVDGTNIICSCNNNIKNSNVIPLSSSSTSLSSPVVEAETKINTTATTSKTPSDGQELPSSGYSRRLKKRPPSLFVSRAPTANNSLTSPPLECKLPLHSNNNMNMNTNNNNNTFHGIPHCSHSSLSSSSYSHEEPQQPPSSSSLQSLSLLTSPSSHHTNSISAALEHHTLHSNNKVKITVDLALTSTHNNNNNTNTNNNTSLVNVISAVTSSSELVQSSHLHDIKSKQDVNYVEKNISVENTSVLSGELRERKDNGDTNYVRQRELNECSGDGNINITTKSNNPHVDLLHKITTSEIKCAASEVSVKSPIYQQQQHHHQQRALSECSTGSALTHFATVNVPHYCQHYSLSHSFGRNTCELNSPLTEESNSFTQTHNYNNNNNNSLPITQTNTFASDNNNISNHNCNDVNSDISNSSFISAKNNMTSTNRLPSAMQPTEHLATRNIDCSVKPKLYQEEEHQDIQKYNKEKIGMMETHNNTCNTNSTIHETSQDNKIDANSCHAVNREDIGDMLNHNTTKLDCSNKERNDIAATASTSTAIANTIKAGHSASLTSDPHYAEAVAMCEVYFPSTTTKPAVPLHLQHQSEEEAAITTHQPNISLTQQLEQKQEQQIKEQCVDISPEINKEFGTEIYTHHHHHHHHHHEEEEEQCEHKHKCKEEDKPCTEKAKPLHVRLSRDGSTLMAGEFRVNSEGCLTVHNFLLLNPHHTHSTKELYKESSTEPLSYSVGQTAITSVLPINPTVTANTTTNTNMLCTDNVYNMYRKCNANQTYATTDSAIGEISTHYLEGSLPSPEKLEKINICNNNNNIDNKAYSNNILHFVGKEELTSSEQFINDIERKEEHQVNTNSNELSLCSKEYARDKINVLCSENIINHEDSKLLNKSAGKEECNTQRRDVNVDSSDNISKIDNHLHETGLESSPKTSNENDFAVLQERNVKINLTIDTSACHGSEAIHKPVVKAPLLRPCMPMTPVNTRNMISAAGRVAAAAAAANALRSSYLNLPGNIGSISSGSHGLGLHSHTLHAGIGNSNDNLVNLAGTGLTPLSPSYSPMVIPLSPDAQDLLTSDRYYFDPQNTIYNNNNNNNTITKEKNANHVNSSNNNNSELEMSMSKQMRKVDFQVGGNKQEEELEEEEYTPLNIIHTSPNKRQSVEDIINHSMANNHPRHIQPPPQQPNYHNNINNNNNHHHHDNEFMPSMRRVESQQALHSTTSHLPPSFTGYENNSFTLQSASMNMPYSPITYSMDSLHFPETNTINNTLLHRRSEVREFEPLLQARKHTTVLDSHVDRKQSSQYGLNMSTDNNGLTQSRSSHLQRDDSFMTIAQVGELLRRSAITSCDSNKSTPKANLLQSPLMNEMPSRSVTENSNGKVITNAKDNEHKTNSKEAVLNSTSPVKVTSPFDDNKYTNAINTTTEVEVNDNAQVGQTVCTSNECHNNALPVNNIDKSNTNKSNKVSPNSENNYNDITMKAEFVHVAHCDQLSDSGNNLGQLKPCNKHVKENVVIRSTNDLDNDDDDDHTEVVLSHLQATKHNSNNITSTHASQCLLPYVELQYHHQLLEQEVNNDRQSADNGPNNNNNNSIAEKTTYKNNSGFNHHEHHINHHKKKMLISQRETCANEIKSPCERHTSMSNLTMKHIALPSNVVRYHDLIITNPVGEGASASVFLAIHTPTRRRLAVKRVNLEPLCLSSNLTWGNHSGRLFRGACESARSRELRQIVIRELQVLHLSYRSPFMVKVYNAFYLPNIAALDIVMEFMHYGSIDHLAENLMRHAKQLELQEQLEEKEEQKEKEEEHVSLHVSENEDTVAHDEKCEKETNVEKREMYHHNSCDSKSNNIHLDESVIHKEDIVKQCNRDENLESSPQQEEISLPQSFQSSNTLMCSSDSSQSAPILTTQALRQIELQKNINTSTTNNTNSASFNSSSTDINTIIARHKRNISNNNVMNKGENKVGNGVSNMMSSFSFSYSSSLADVDEKGSVEEVNGVAERVVAVVGEQLLRGVRDMHDRGYIHRDIKPGNVLVNEYGVVKLSDFGLSRRCVPSQHPSKDEQVLHSDSDDSDSDDNLGKRVEDVHTFERNNNDNIDRKCEKIENEEHMLVSGYATNALEEQQKQQQEEYKQNKMANSISCSRTNNNNYENDNNGCKVDCFRGLPLSLAQRHSYDAHNVITRGKEQGPQYNNQEVINKNAASPNQYQLTEIQHNCRDHHAKCTCRQSKKASRRISNKEIQKLLLREDASENEVSDTSSSSSSSSEEEKPLSIQHNEENKKYNSASSSSEDEEAGDDNDDEYDKEEEWYIEEELQCSGTLNYMSPERLRGEPHGKANDIWAVGVTLAEFALGTYPYNLENVTDIFDRMQRMEKPVQCEPHNSRRKRPLSETFQDFVHLATLPIASQRPTAQELLEHPFFKQWLTPFDLKSYLAERIPAPAPAPTPANLQENKLQTMEHLQETMQKKPV